MLNTAGPIVVEIIALYRSYLSKMKSLSCLEIGYFRSNSLSLESLERLFLSLADLSIKSIHSCHSLSLSLLRPYLTLSDATDLSISLFLCLFMQLSLENKIALENRSLSLSLSN